MTSSQRTISDSGYPAPPRGGGGTRVKAYLNVTAAVFALLATVHLWRIGVEGMQVLADPFFAISTLTAVLLCAWALRLRSRQPT
jgi:hypothetical protein